MVCCPCRGTKLGRIGVVTTGPLQLLPTAVSMAACINAIMGGVTMALAVRSLLDAPVWMAAATASSAAMSADRRPGSLMSPRISRQAAAGGPATASDPGPQT